MQNFMVQKTYFDFVNAITADELYRKLMTYGLFAEKLPPFLSGEFLCEYVLSSSVHFHYTRRQCRRRTFLYCRAG